MSCAFLALHMVNVFSCLISLLSSYVVLDTTRALRHCSLIYLILFCVLAGVPQNKSLVCAFSHAFSSRPCYLLFSGQLDLQSSDRLQMKSDDNPHAVPR